MSEKADVYVVDDDKMLRTLISKMISSLGLSVAEFSDGDEALAATKKNPPKLMVLDKHMPLMKGDELMIELSNLKIIDAVSVFLVTSESMDESEKFRMYSLGVAEVFSKPLKKEPFLLRVQAELEIGVI